jgi:hypothetical protein
MPACLRARAGSLALLPAFACGLEIVELDPPEVGEAAASAEDGESEAASREAPEAPAAGSSRAEAAASAGTEAGAGCTKLDFLFVIDNSLSMAFAQGNLRASFAGLLDVLEDGSSATDLHVMVVDTDSLGDAPPEPGCEGALGAGRRSSGQSGEDCGLPATQRFAASSPELEPAFACLATVGTSGEAREQQAGAMLAATAREQNEPGGCNAGFLREDAVLIVSLITNTDDDASAFDPDAWYEALVAQKDGQEASIVMLAFLPGDAFAPSSSGLLCNVVASLGRAPRLEALVTRFTHHQIASVCEADYGPVFATAVRDIDRACEAFVPPRLR